MRTASDESRSMDYLLQFNEGTPAAFWERYEGTEMIFTYCKLVFEKIVFLSFINRELIRRVRTLSVDLQITGSFHSFILFA